MRAHANGIEVNAKKDGNESRYTYNMNGDKAEKNQGTRKSKKKRTQKNETISGAFFPRCCYCCCCCRSRKLLEMNESSGVEHYIFFINHLRMLQSEFVRRKSLR